MVILWLDMIFKWPDLFVSASKLPLTVWDNGCTMLRDSLFSNKYVKGGTLNTISAQEPGRGTLTPQATNIEVLVTTSSSLKTGRALPRINSGERQDWSAACVNIE
jgi:hypothetical protein